MGKDDQALLQGATPAWRKSGIIIKTPEQIRGIREAGRITAQLLDLVAERIRPGITTNQINEWVHQGTLERGGIPAPLNYKGFPKSVCTSVNDVICHGIPEDRVLQEGDIINVDVTTKLNGYYGDASRMFCIGEVTKEARTLVDITQECLNLGIEQVRPGATTGDIGHAIQTHAEKHGYSIVRDFTGHGTGVNFHEEPIIQHYGKPGKGVVLVPNMVFTIEPMLNQGTRHCKVLKDGWTAITTDGKLSAQWEHTLQVTENGYELMTVI